MNDERLDINHKMYHVTANNEIIRMRATVRKARVGVVWKLTKQTKLLKNRKHGDEKTLKKCKKKAEKFIKEIKAIKRLKDDDITKFAILNVRNLQEVLMDLKADRKTRVLTRLAFHKSLEAAVNKFREKFPHYKLGKRQLTNHKPTKSLLMIATPREIERGNREDEDKGMNSENAEENDNENEDCDDENSSRYGKSEEETSVVSNNFDAESSEEELDLQNKKSEFESENKTSEFVENEIKLLESKCPMKTRISGSGELKRHKVSRKKIPPSSDSNSNEKTIEKNLPQSSKMNPLRKNKKLDSKQSRNPNFPQKDIPSAPSNYLRGNIIGKTPELTLTTPLLQSQKPWREFEKSNSSNPEIFSNIPATSESNESPQNPQKIKIVSNFASVKRLRIGESLEETDEILENLNFLSQEHKMELDTEEDSFFISASPGGVYKSMIVPRQNTKTLEGENADDRFREQFLSTQRASSNSTNSSHHREKTACFRKSHRARQNNIEKNKRDFLERKEFFEEERGAEFRKTDKFKNNRGRVMVEKKLDCEKNLHPSWIAKKKEQEVLKQGFQGKKIVFSDD